MAQSKWIEFNNINNTQAMLIPSNFDVNYDINNYTVQKYLSQNNDIYNEYHTWINAHQELKTYNEQTKMLKFLIENKYYPKYLWWSRKGYCIYKYIGYHLINKYKW